MSMYYRWIPPDTIVEADAMDLESHPQHVGDDTINGIRVSTVFLHIDHNHLRDGPPILFETMLFNHEAYDWKDLGEMERYCTAQEAREGHARWCEVVRKETAPRPVPDPIPVMQRIGGHRKIRIEPKRRK